MILRLVIVLCLLLSLIGCASVGSKYEFVVREPLPGIYWIEIRLNAERWGDPDWKSRATATADEVIRSEMTRLRLPHSTIYVGEPIPYEGTWASIFATASDLPEAETRHRIAEFQKTQADGQRLPPAIIRFRATFRKEEPNKQPQQQRP